jgi:hypothetical protein
VGADLDEPPVDMSEGGNGDGEGGGGNSLHLNLAAASLEDRLLTRGRAR